VSTFGKTTISLYIAQQLGLKTLVVVHKSFLQNQWYDRIKQFTNAKIGMIRQNKIDTKDKDIVVAMLHSISMKDYDLSIFDQFGCVIFDECFIRKERVITSDGPIPIGQLYDMWIAGKKLPLIKSFNEQTKKFEFKRMTYAWEKRSTALVKVQIGCQSVICTPNHLFLTTHGYKEASKLTKSDVLIGVSNNKHNHCSAINVVKQEISLKYEYVYDIEVEDNHNFIIGSDGNAQFNPIVHNCHHLAARVFSKAMMKTGGHYTIGLSATPQRADGLTKVINWYLGDIIYRIVRKGDKNVAVRMFNYDTKDKLFVEKKQYIKGKTVLSMPRMITNLGKITGRNKFLIDILNKLKNEDERKILVLSNRIAHLELLKDELDKEIKKDVEKGTLVDGEVITAFYIGRMKDIQLTLAAEADIIFASYAMAEEGLDIDKLNTLVLATPKKNIIQSIGRILRKPIKEGDINPLIVDIVDELSIFSSWGNKRQEYYNKEGYKVESYQAMTDKCVSVKDYLVKKGVITSSQSNVDLRKEFICYKYGQESWELEQDLMSDDEKDLPPDPKYTNEPDLIDILKVSIEI